MAKSIYCPQCNRKVATYDGKTSFNIEVVCKKCKKLIIYRPENNSVEIKEKPERVTASGKRFY